MPTIPIYRRQVGTDKLPTPYERTPIVNPGEAVGDGLQQVGGALQKAGAAVDAETERTRQLADKASTAQATAELSRYLSEQVHGNPVSGSRGFIGLEGIDAIRESAPRATGADKKAQEIAARLTQRQREEFEARAAQMVQSARNSIATHATRQLDVVYQQSFSAQIEQLANDAADVASDEAALGKILQSAGDEAASFARLQGLPGSDEITPGPDSPVASYVRKARSGVLESALTAAAGKTERRDIKAARRIIDQYGEALPDIVAKWGPVVADAELNEKVLGTLDELRQKHRRGHVGASFLDSPAFGKAILEAEGDEEFKQRLRSAAASISATERNMENEEIGNVFDRALTEYRANRRGLSGINEHDASWLKQNAPKQWEWFRNDAMAAFERANTGGASRASQAQHEALIELRQRLRTNPEEFEGKTPKQFMGEWGHRLHDSDIDGAGKEFVTAQQEWANRDSVKDTAFRNQINTVLGSSDKLSKKGKLNEAGKAAFAELVDWRWQLGKEEKREPTKAEVEAKLIEMLSYGDTRGGSFFAPNKFVYQDPAVQPFDADEQPVPFVRARMGGKPEAAPGAAPAPAQAPAAKPAPLPIPKPAKVATVNEDVPAADWSAIQGELSRTGNDVPDSAVIAEYNAREQARAMSDEQQYRQQQAEQRLAAEPKAAEPRTIPPEIVAQLHAWWTSSGREARLGRKPTEAELLSAYASIQAKQEGN